MDLVVQESEFGQYLHESMHYLQEINEGFGASQLKGMHEQLLNTFGISNPYVIFGTNEYDAYKYELIYRK